MPTLLLDPAEHLGLGFLGIEPRDRKELVTLLAERLLDLGVLGFDLLLARFQLAQRLFEPGLLALDRGLTFVELCLALVQSALGLADLFPAGVDLFVELFAPGAEFLLEFERALLLLCLGLDLSSLDKAGRLGLC